MSGADLAELARLRDDMGAHAAAGARTVIQDIRIRAARTIQRVKREDELEEQRQRLFVLAEDATAAERTGLRRRVADARPEDVPRLEQEVTAAVQRASAVRSQAEAVRALGQSLQELGYDVQGGFASLLPSSAAPSSAAPSSAESQAGAQSAGARPAPRFLVAASPHSAATACGAGRQGRPSLERPLSRAPATAAKGENKQEEHPECPGADLPGSGRCGLP